MKRLGVVLLVAGAVAATHASRIEHGPPATWSATATFLVVAGCVCLAAGTLR